MITKNKNFSRLSIKVLLIILIVFLIGFFYKNNTSLKFKFVKNITYLKDDQLKNKNFHITTRAELGSIMKKLNGKTMIEVGVQTGSFAFEVLKRWPSFEHYYGIDPWQKQENYFDGANIDDKRQNVLYEGAKRRLSIFGSSRIKLIREYSNKAVKYFDDFSIDLIYIDARHDYCSVLEDIQLYFPKLKCGGVFAGHDYLNVEERYKLSNQKEKKNGDYSICPDGTRVLKNGGAVKGAVIEFFNQNKNMRIYETKEAFPSWYSFKKC